MGVLSGKYEMNKATLDKFLEEEGLVQKIKYLYEKEAGCGGAFKLYIYGAVVAKELRRIKGYVPNKEEYDRAIEIAEMIASADNKYEY